MNKGMKHLPSKKQMQKKTPDTKEQIVYSELKIDTSNSNQAKIRRNRSSKEKGSSVPFSWYLTVVILGSFCFLLLLTNGILGFMVFQGHQADQPQKPPLDNITQEDKYESKNMSFPEKSCNTGNKTSTCKSKWLCCEESCYHFSHELMKFEESKKLCKRMNSKLLKIEDKEELEQKRMFTHGMCFFH
nr:killer cell lectin-like receptor 2 isoform X2 [Loxodonta africana]